MDSHLIHTHTHQKNYAHETGVNSEQSFYINIHFNLLRRSVTLTVLVGGLIALCTQYMPIVLSKHHMYIVHAEVLAL